MPARHITVSADGQIHELCILHEREATSPTLAPSRKRTRHNPQEAAHSADILWWAAWHAGRLVLLMVVAALACALIGATAHANVLERAAAAVGLLAIALCTGAWVVDWWPQHRVFSQRMDVRAPESSVCRDAAAKMGP